MSTLQPIKNLLSPRKKAAVLMIALGPEVSSQIFRYLTQDEIEELTLEIASIRSVDADTRKQVIEEFDQLCQAHSYLQKGGVDYARELLAKAFGEEEAENVLRKLTSNLQIRPFEFIRTADAAQVLSLIQNEHPQTIALILAYLDSQQSAAILMSLPAEMQMDVARRIATMHSTSPEIIREVEQVVENKLSSLVTEGSMQIGGIETVVALLNNVDRSTERLILESLALEDPELVEAIKKRMFVFEDILLLDNRSIQRVLREVDMHGDMAMALKASSEEVKNKIFMNLSKRAVDDLKETMDYLGPVRLRDVEEAQQRIVSIIRRLEEAGDIVISRSGEDDLIV